MLLMLISTVNWLPSLNFLNCWKLLRALLTTASRKTKPWFKNNRDWTISSEASTERRDDALGGMFNDYCEADRVEKRLLARNRRHSKSSKDIVWPVRDYRVLPSGQWRDRGSALF